MTVKQVMIVRGMNQSIKADDSGNSVMDSVNLVLTDSVRYLEVIYDEPFNFVTHINLLFRDCNYYMRNVGAIRRYQDRSSVVTFLHYLILSKRFL